MIFILECFHFADLKLYICKTLTLYITIMDAEALKIILDLQSQLYNRAISDILLFIHHDFDVKSINYNLGSPTDQKLATIMHDLSELKSRARLFDKLQQQSNNGKKQ